MRITTLLEQIPEPRECRIVHPKEEIIFLVISAMCAGMKKLTAMEEWGDDCLEWLRGFLP
jgi:hypothetical protein